MKKSYFLLGIVAIIAISALILRLSALKSGKEAEMLAPITASSTANLESVASATVPIAGEPQASFTEEALVISPKQGEIIVSPLRVEGEALGSWFFEATLPIKLIDEGGNVIASHYGTAVGDWMTVKPVKFVSDLSFTTAATSGYLVVAKDNPSGLPENDAFIKVPVRFK